MPLVFTVSSLTTLDFLHFRTLGRENVVLAGHSPSVVGNESTCVAFDFEAETLHDRVGPLPRQNVRQLGQEEERQGRRGRGQNQGSDRDKGQGRAIGHQVG